jgi:hypothetical protein
MRLFASLFLDFICNEDYGARTFQLFGPAADGFNLGTFKVGDGAAGIILMERETIQFPRRQPTSRRKQEQGEQEGATTCSCAQFLLLIPPV